MPATRRYAGSLTFYDDVGFGLRLLIPQLNTYALALTGPSPCGRRPACPPAGRDGCHSGSVRSSDMGTLKRVPIPSRALAPAG